ncbi:hypothetical protein NL676_020897 [Syzygium grande]|nr:hypothetical protein NL676_020897 [Syzygium grande]
MQREPANPDPASGQGHAEELGGFKSYVSVSSDSNLAIVLMSDVFGSLLTRSQILDFIGGDPSVPENAERPVTEWLRIMELWVLDL